MGIGRWRPLAVVVLSAVSVGGLVVSLAWPDPDSQPELAASEGTGSGGAASPSPTASLAGWNDSRWPIRGDLAGDDSVRAAVESAIQAEYAGDPTHLLWLGGGERPTAYVVVPDGQSEVVAAWQRGPGGDWSAAGTPAIAVSPDDPGVALPATEGAPPAYLAAADIVGVTAVVLGAEGVVTIPVPADDGLTTVDPASVPPPAGCAAPLLRFDRAEGSDYLPPWEAWGGGGLLARSTPADAPAPTPDLLASLVAGVCASGVGAPTQLSWPLLDFPALDTFPDPDGSAAVASLAWDTTVTLAYVPAGGTTPAILGRTRPERDPAHGAELAVVLDAGQAGESVVLAVQVSGPPATVPDLPEIVSQPGLAVLGPLSTPDAPVAVVYAGPDGQPVGTELIR